jgi:hypothetical protein
MAATDDMSVEAEMQHVLVLPGRCLDLMRWRTCGSLHHDYHRMSLHKLVHLSNLYLISYKINQSIYFLCVGGSELFKVLADLEKLYLTKKYIYLFRLI